MLQFLDFYLPFPSFIFLFLLYLFLFREEELITIVVPAFRFGVGQNIEIGIGVGNFGNVVMGGKLIEVTCRQNLCAKKIFPCGLQFSLIFFAEAIEAGRIRPLFFCSFLKR